MTSGRNNSNFNGKRTKKNNSEKSILVIVTYDPRAANYHKSLRNRLRPTDRIRQTKEVSRA